MANIDTALTISGVGEYTRSIKAVENELRILKSAMKATSEEYKSNADSVEALKAKQDILQAQIIEQSKIVDQARVVHEKFRSVHGESAQDTVKMANNVNNAVAALAQMKNELTDVNTKLSEAKTKESEHGQALETSKNTLQSLEKTLDVYDSQLDAIEKQQSKGVATSQQAKQMQDALKEAYTQSQTVVSELENQLELLKTTVGENSDEFKDMQIRLNETKEKMYEFESSIQKSYEKLLNLGENLQNIGADMTSYITMPILGLGTAVTKFGIDFESAFTGVKKTVDTTVEGYERLRQGILDMDIPVDKSIIAGVMEIAGQLGIAEENLLSFSRTMIDMSESTNLAANKAASEMARFANITQMPQSEFERLGSVIVDLGNNLATQEDEISSMGLNLAAAGGQAGLAASEIMGFSGVISSLGVEAEKGGSAASKLFRQITTAVKSGNDELAAFASIAGETTESFKAHFEQDAAGAITSFIQGLGRINESGGDLTSTLGDLGITETRMIDVVSRLAGAGDLLASSLDMANKAWEENTALTTEAEKRYATTASQIQGLWTDIKELGIEFSDVIIPTVRDVIATLRDLTQGISNMDDGTKETIIKMGLFAAAIGPVISATGSLMTVIGTVQGAIAVMNGSMIASTPAVAGLATAMTSAAGAASAFGMVINTTILGPLALITTAVAVGALVWKGYEKAQEEARQEIIHAGEDILYLRDRLDEISQKQNNVDSLVESWKSLSQAVKANAGSSDELTQKRKDLAAVEQQLINTSDGIISQYDIENGLIDEKVALLESQIKLEQEIAQIEIDQILSTTSNEIIQTEINSLEDKRLRLLEQNRAQTEAYTRLIELSAQYNAISNDESLSLGEKREKTKELKSEVYELANAFGISAVHASQLLESPMDSTINGELAKTGDALKQVNNELIEAKKTQAAYQNVVNESEDAVKDFEATAEEASGAVIDLSKAYEDAAKAFEDTQKQYKKGELDTKAYNEALGKQMIEAAKLSNSNTELGKTYQSLSKDIKKELLDNLKDSTSELISETDKLSSAFAEQNEEKKLSYKTISDLINCGYSLALQIDEETGAVTLNKEAFIELERAKIQNRLADIELAKSNIKAQLFEECGAAEAATKGYDQLAMKKFIAAQAGNKDLTDMEMETNLLKGLLNNVDSVTDSYKKKKGATKDAAKEAINVIKDEIEKLKLYDDKFGMREELEIWEKAQKKYKEDSKERIEIDQNIKKLRTQIESDAYKEAVKNIENRAELEGSTNKELIDGYEELRREFSSNEEMKLELTKKITSLQKEEVKKYGEAATEAIKKGYEKSKDDAVDFLDKFKDVEKTQKEIVRDKSKEKIDIISDEYIRRIEKIDAITAAQLKSCNQQIQKEIERISYIDAELAKELESRRERIAAIDAELEADKKASEDKRHQEKLTSLNAKIAAAETEEARIEAEKAYREYVEEWDQKQKDKRLNEEKKALENEIKTKEKVANDEIALAKDNIAEEQKAQDVHLKNFKNLLDEMKKALIEYYQDLTDKAPELAAQMFASGDTDAMNKLNELITEYNPDWQDKGNGFMDYLNKIQKSGSTDILDDSVTYDTEQIEENYSTVNSMINEQQEAVVTEFDGMSEDIKDILVRLADDTYKIGKQTVQGFLDGVSLMIPQVEHTAREIAAIVAAAMRAELEVASPSKVTRQIGRWTGLGLAMGIEDTEDDVVRATKSLLSNIRFESAQIGGTAGTAAMQAGGIYNDTINNYTETGRNVYLTIGRFENRTDKDIQALSEDLAFVVNQAGEGRGRRRGL